MPVLIITLLIVLPQFLGSYYQYMGSMILINITAAIGLNLLMGNSGQVSVCSSAFVAIGAYSTTLLQTRLGIPYWVAFPMGAVIAGFAGLILGFPALRVRGFYLAVVTMGFLEIVIILMEELEWLTGGVRGLLSPRPSIFGYKLSTDLSFYYVILAVALLGIWVARSILSSPTGRAFDSIRNNQAVSQTLGVPLTRTKLIAFVLSAVYAGIAGGLLAPLVGFLDPLAFNAWASLQFTVYIVVGGMGSVIGSVIGATVFTIIPELIRNFGELNEFVFSGILLIVLIFLPGGLVSLGPKIMRFVSVHIISRLHAPKQKKRYPA